MKASQDYLSQQLIAYIGNKRSLLGFLEGLFREWMPPGAGRRFLDPFAGSGATSRLARAMGYQVFSNDWEPYAYTVGRAHLEPCPQDLKILLAPTGGPEETFDELHRIATSGKVPNKPYFSRLFAPQNTHSPKIGKERLFYTQENARYLDHSREWVDQHYPAPSLGRTILLSSLIYQASVHSNTSGVFKAYHKGFGGHGRDALSRIMAPMRAQTPVLWDSQLQGKMFQQDAREFVASQKADLVYLDPPYNQHQYGSNYHLLNTIALGDFPPAPLEQKEDGSLVSKAGIRQDWKDRRSSYCNRKEAPKAFAALLEAIHAPVVAVSYNTEGIIPFQEMYQLLAKGGRTKVISQDYVKYRGGRQSNQRLNQNLELVFLQDRREKPKEGDWAKVKEYQCRRALSVRLRQRVNPGKIQGPFYQMKQELFWRDSQKPVGRLESGGQIRVDETNLGELASTEIEKLREDLGLLVCDDRIEEAQVLLDALVEPQEPKVLRELSQELLKVMRKFAFRKYRSEYQGFEKRVRGVLVEHPRLAKYLEKRLEELTKIADLRFR